MAWLICLLRVIQALTLLGGPRGRVGEALIFSALTHSSSHRCGFEPSSGHMWDIGHMWDEAKFCLRVFFFFFFFSRGSPVFDPSYN